MGTFGWVTLKLQHPATNGHDPEEADVTPSTNGEVSHGKAVVLGPRDRLVGQLYVEGDLRVTGTVEGAIEATGSIEIDGGGSVSGPVTAYDRLVVGSEGSLAGDVRVSRLVVEDGATFSGNVSMGKSALETPRPAVPAPIIPMKAAEPVPVQVVAQQPVIESKAKPREKIRRAGLPANWQEVLPRSKPKKR
jgi:cytoskeletal protein CcmA (bactofilin family)